MRGNREGGKDLRFNLRTRWEADRRRDRKLLSNDKWEKSAAWSCDGLVSAAAAAGSQPVCQHCLHRASLAYFIPNTRQHNRLEFQEEYLMCGACIIYLLPAAIKAIKAAARGGEGSTWSRRASSRSRDHPYSQQLHQRRLVSRQRKTRFSMRGTNIQGLITSCSTSHVRQTLLRHLDHKKSCVKAETWSLLLPFLLI